MNGPAIKRSRSLVGTLLLILAICALLGFVLWLGGVLVLMARMLYGLLFALHDIVRGVLGSP
jgi:hypothetical protein